MADEETVSDLVRFFADAADANKEADRTGRARPFGPQAMEELNARIEKATLRVMPDWSEPIVDLRSEPPR